LKEQLRKLIQLQQVDTQIRAQEFQKETYPAEIKKLAAQITLKTEAFEEEAARIDSLEKERRQKERELEAAGEKIEKIQGQLHEVKTNKEYQAFLLEIEHLKEKIANFEMEILEHLDTVDTLREAIKETEKTFKEEKAALEKKKALLENNIVHLPDALTALLEERNKLEEAIPENILKKYKTLVEKRGGIAVSYVKDEICQGCHMNIPPQLFNQVQRADKINFCPHCNRILVPPEEEKEEKT
jgi:predicted  nucleic acid-binding Zn-ribbon protein